MAQMPIEIVEIGDVPRDAIGQAVALSNSVQHEFVYSVLSEADAEHFHVHAFRRMRANDFLDTMEGIRKQLRGYHPYLLSVVDAELQGEDYGNIFGSNRAETGVGVLTTSNVPEVIIPSDRMTAYFLYYLARYTLSFVVPSHKNHDDTRECVYDRKVHKLDLLKSMRARSLCDDCRKVLLNEGSPLSPRQLTALDKIFDLSGRILGQDERDAKERRLPRTFIGSSSEGLPIANKLQSLLEHDVDAEIWNQGTVFGLGDVTLEALEAAVQAYEFGIFVFTPDDQLSTRGVIKPVARDNVIFELGLFVGKLSRRHAFVINPSKNAISLPSDLAGIATATYDPDKPNLSAALGPACQKIREAVARARMKSA